MAKVYDCLIIGSGPAGLTAAIYLSRGGFDILLLTGDEVGGQLMQTTDIENFPGFESIAGAELMAQMQSQAKKFGVNVELDQVDEVISMSSFQVKTSSGKVFRAKTVIVAVGASAKWLDVPGTVEFKGKGVSACATCDGPFFKEKLVSVIGGGDTAFTEVEFLSRFASKVYLIHRRENFRAKKILQSRVFKDKKVVPLFNSQVLQFLGGPKLSFLKIETKFSVENSSRAKEVNQYPQKYGREIERGEESVIWQLPVDGAFIAVGHQPNTNFLEQTIELDGNGYIRTKDDVFTSIDGLFAAGDCVDFKYRQAVIAAGMGCKAALEVEEWLKEND